MVETEKCECGSTDFRRNTDRGEITCIACGLVLHDHLLAHGCEKRSFTKEDKDKRERVGKPLRNLLPDMGLTTTMYYDKNTNQSINKKQNFYRLNKAQNRLSWKEKHLSLAVAEINRLCGQLSLTYQIREASATFYRKIIKKNLLKGRSINSMVIVAIYICCRQANITMTLPEITNLSNEPIKRVRKSYKVILKAFNLQIITINPITLITRIGGELKISNKVEREAIKLLKEVMKSKNFLGKDPKGIACASIYLSCLKNNETLTQKEISSVGNITEVTIRNRIKDFKTIKSHM